MPKLVSELIGVSRSKFDETGAFNALLDMDSRFFIDPRLLEGTSAPEIASTRAIIEEFFYKIIKLLVKSTSKDDIFWRNALRMFSFPEVKGLCLGYSKFGTAGSGMGSRYQEILISTAKEIVDEGIKDPEFFELLGILEKGVGPDRISDMFAKIMHQNLLEYSERIFSMFDVDESKITTVTMNNKTYRVLKNPFNSEPLILAPKDILSKLPVADSYLDVEDLCSRSQHIRDYVNSIIGKIGRNRVKEILRREFLSDESLRRGIIDEYKLETGNPYDFDNDPDYQTDWIDDSRLLVDENPCNIKKNPTKNEEFIEIVEQFCSWFEDTLSKEKYYFMVYQDDHHPKKEIDIQKLFFASADYYLSDSNIQVSPEKSDGSGMTSFAYAGFTVKISLKLSLSRHLIPNYEKLSRNLNSSKNVKYMYIVISVTLNSKDYEDRISDLLTKMNSLSNKLKVPKIFIVDATRESIESKAKKGDKVLIFEPSDLHRQIDVAIITIKDEEQQAVENLFEKKGIVNGKYGAYSYFEINIDGRTIKIVTVQTMAQGTNHAQKSTDGVINDLDPNWIFIVGIGGGRPSDEFTLGDVVLANWVGDASIKSITDGAIESAMSGYSVGFSVKKLIQIARIHPEIKKFYESIQIDKPKLDLSTSQFYGSDEYKDEVRSSLEKYQGTDPKFTSLSIISSNDLVKSVELVHHYKEIVRQAKVFEMEAAGVFIASERPDKTYPVLVIRGISDIVGFKRSNDLTEYACGSAASFAYALINSGILGEIVKKIDKSDSSEIKDIDPRDNHISLLRLAKQNLAEARSMSTSEAVFIQITLASDRQLANAEALEKEGHGVVEYKNSKWVYTYPKNLFRDGTF